MNRDQAIERARNLRKGMVVAVFVPKNPSDENTKAHWKHEEFKSVGAAKRRMRELGCGVALTDKEALPKGDVK